MALKIPDIELNRIFTMFRQGYKVTTISRTTGYSCEVIEARVRRHKIIRNKTIVAAPRKPGKYDYLFFEQTAQGRMYIDYFKK